MFKAAEGRYRVVAYPMTTSSTTMAVIKLPRLAGERKPNIAKPGGEVTGHCRQNYQVEFRPGMIWSTLHEPMVMTVMASVCTPEPTEAARSMGQAGARKTSA
jgi:hypothetical protein